MNGGQPVNPDGIRNQVEGAIIQALSWTLFERVNFDPRARRKQGLEQLSDTLGSIRRPGSDRRACNKPGPGMPYLGTGECGQGRKLGSDRQCGCGRNRFKNSRHAAVYTRSRLIVLITALLFLVSSLDARYGWPHAPSYRRPTG